MLAFALSIVSLAFSHILYLNFGLTFATNAQKWEPKPFYFVHCMQVCARNYVIYIHCSSIRRFEKPFSMAFGSGIMSKHTSNAAES